MADLFKKVKDGLPVSGDGYDGQIITQIKAAVLDLTSSAEIVLDGTVDIERTENTPVTTSEPVTYTITDNSTIEDELVITAITIWCTMRIGNPPNYDKLLQAYQSIKGQMRQSSMYSNF